MRTANAASAAPAPPRGTGAHRYMFVVHALDVPRLDLGAGCLYRGGTSGSRCFFHGLARAILTGTAEHPDG